MAAKLPVWGIDVGQCSLKALRLQPVEDRLEVIGFDLVEHKQILSQAETDSVQLITKSIETFASRNELAGSRVVISVPGQQTLTRFTRMPPVDAKKIPDMVQYEASQQIPFDMDEVVWDYQVFTEGDSAEVEVGIFAIRRELIRTYLSHFTDRGIEPIIVQTGPIASYNAARHEISLPEGRAAVLLDMGALATDLIIMEGGRIWSRPVPIGGNRFSEALVSAFKIPFRKAERLKRGAASSKYARQIFQAMRPVFADLVSEIQRSIGFYTSTHRDADVNYIICMGNAFKLPGLQKFLQQNLQIKVEQLAGFKKLSVPALERKTEFDENVMSLAVAYGLCLQGLGLATVKSNLLPGEVRRTLLWRKKRPWFAAGAACLAVAAGAMWVGNVSAQGELNQGLGDLSADSLTPTNHATADAAMNAINSPPSGPAAKLARDMLGAAHKLEREFQSANRSISEEASLKRLAKFPENNVFVPRVIDIIHSAFAAANSKAPATAASAEEYRRLAASTRRPQREEAWIERMMMVFTADPQSTLDRTTPKVSPVGKEGWAIELTGITPLPNPAGWLQENLIKPMEKLGRKPKRGFYFESVELNETKPRAKRSTARTPRGISPSDDDRGGGSRGQRGGRRVEGPSEGSPGSRGGGGNKLPGIELPGAGGAPAKPTGFDTAGLSEWLEQFDGKDPLTLEDLGTDYEFVLHIVVRKKDTPNDMLPEEYKEPKEKPEAAPKG